MLLDNVNQGREDAEPIFVGKFLVLERHWPKDTYLLDQHLPRVLLAFKWDLGRLKDVPIVAPY